MSGAHTPKAETAKTPSVNCLKYRRRQEMNSPDFASSGARVSICHLTHRMSAAGTHVRAWHSIVHAALHAVVRGLPYHCFFGRYRLLPGTFSTTQGAAGSKLRTTP